MICRKCGHELADNAKICDGCGASMEIDQAASLVHTDADGGSRQPEIYADFPWGAGNSPKPRKKRIFARIIIVLLIAVIAVCGLAVLGYYTFLPAKHVLLAAEYFTVQKTCDALESHMARKEKLSDALYATTTTSSTDFSISIDPATLEGSGLDAKTVDIVRDYLTNLSFNLTTEVDPQGRKQNVSAVLSYKNNPGLSVNALVHGSDFGLNLPQLSKISLIGRFKDLSRLYDLYGQDYDLEEYDSIEIRDPWLSNSLREEIEIGHEDIEELIRTYAWALLNGLDNDDLTIEGGRKTNLLGEETSCRAVTATLDRKSQMNLIETVLDTAKNDDNLYDLTIGNFKKAYKILTESDPAYAEVLDGFAGYYGIDLEKDLTQTNYKLIILDSRNNLTEDMFPEEMIIRFYIEGLYVVKYEFEFPSQGGGKAVIALENVMDGDSVDSRITYDEPGVATVVFDAGKLYDTASDTRDETYGFSISAQGQEGANVDFRLDLNEDPESGGAISQKIGVAASYDISGGFLGAMRGDLGISLDGVVKRNRDGLPEKSDSRIDVIINSPSLMSQEMKFTLGVENETVYGEKVELPGWASHNTLDLEAASDDELDSYFNEIYRNLSILLIFLGIT